MSKKHPIIKNGVLPVFPSYKKFIAIVIAAFFAVYPLITYMKILTLSGKTKEWFPNDQGLTVDFFLYWKSAALILFAVFLLLFFVGEFLFPDHRITNIPLFHKDSRLPLLCVGVFVFFVILSAIFSQNHSVALNGIPTAFEGLFVLLAYIVIFLAGLNYFGSDKARRILSISLFISVTVCSLLAQVEYLYKPILELPFVSYLVAPSQYHELAASLHSEGFRDHVALFFYNPDYFGGFCALLLPPTLSFMMLTQGKIKQWTCGIAAILFFIALLLSRSSGALYATIVVLLLLIVLYRHHLKHWLPRMAVLAVTAVVMLMSVHFASGGRLLSSLTGNLTNTTTTENTNDKFVLQALTVDGDNLLLTGSNDSLRITASDGKADIATMQFNNGSGQPVTPISDNSGFVFDDARYSAIHLVLQGNCLSIDLGYKDTVEFYITANGMKAMGPNGQALENIPTLNPPLKNLYGLATGRGYTWVNSLPILMDCIVVGKGPDNFAFAFPQNDIVGLLNTHESSRFIIDKPHNLYLQTGINTGIPSLIALLILFGCYLIRGIRRYWHDTTDAFGIGIFAGVLAFMIVGLVNDSMVVVNPLFWLLLGVGYASLQKGQAVIKK